MIEKRDYFSFFIFVFFHKRAGMTYNELEVVNKGFILSNLGNKKREVKKVEQRNREAFNQILSDARTSFNEAMNTTKSPQERQHWLQNYKKDMDNLEQELKAQDEAYHKKRALHLKKIQGIIDDSLSDNKV